MIEPKLKKKSFLSKIFKNQFLLTICTVFLLVFILIGSSYALLNTKVDRGLTDVVVQSGNLQATITSEGNIIEKDYNTLGVSDEIGLTYDPYTFTVTNSSENNIAYYELRVVDKEYEISTLPHKSLNYALSVNGSDYTNSQNLGDNRSYIYVGGSLDVGESDTFNLKLWVNEEYGKYANNKVLKASIELTLYSDVPTRNYIIYDSQGGSYISKTNIVSKRISMQTPIKAGYSFTGWSTTPTGNVEYESNAIYNGTNGMTLYAKYEEATITYNLNGGTGEIPSNKASEGITSIVPTKEGYIFKGWSTTANGEVVYQSGASYSGSSITLYAVWGLPPAAELITENLVPYNVSSPTTFNGGLVAVNTNGTLYNESDSTQVIREYRYSGPNVNNYIYFNCKDNDGIYNYGDANYNYNETNCELWRIVGIFKNSQGEWNLKIMRNTVLQASELVSTYTIDGIVYNIQYSTVNTMYWNKNGKDYNDWTTAGIQYFLNKPEDTIGTKGYYSSILSSSKILIDEVYEYVLGNVGSSADTLTAYNNERDGNNISSGNKPNWNGAIALLYPSDIGYAAHSSYWNGTKLSSYSGSAVMATSWMIQNANHSNNEWLISPSSGSFVPIIATTWNSNGIVSYDTVSRDSYDNVGRPVTNLKSSVMMLDGIEQDGSINFPYVIIGE